MSKIKKVDIEYEDGRRQIAHVEPTVIHCELFCSGGGLHSAGEMSPEDFRGELGLDLIESCKQAEKPSEPRDIDIQETVVRELNRRGVMAFYEYPGFVSVPLDGASDGWCLGFGNNGETWGGCINHPETGEVCERPECCIDTGILSDSEDVNLIATELLQWFAVLASKTSYRTKACQWFVISPDDLAINLKAYSSEADARLAIPELCERWRRQGYYKTAECERIPFEQIEGRCSVRTGVEGVVE